MLRHQLYNKARDKATSSVVALPERKRERRRRETESVCVFEKDMYELFLGSSLFQRESEREREGGRERERARERDVCELLLE